VLVDQLARAAQSKVDYPAVNALASKESSGAVSS
jgi:hypothetical protein